MSEDTRTSLHLFQVEDRLPPVLQLGGLSCHVTRWNAHQKGKLGELRGPVRCMIPRALPTSAGLQPHSIPLWVSWATGRELLPVEAQHGVQDTSLRLCGPQTPPSPAPPRDRIHFFNRSFSKYPECYEPGPALNMDAAGGNMRDETPVLYEPYILALKTDNQSSSN